MWISRRSSRCDPQLRAHFASSSAASNWASHFSYRSGCQPSPFTSSEYNLGRAERTNRGGGFLPGQPRPQGGRQHSHRLMDYSGALLLPVGKHLRHLGIRSSGSFQHRDHVLTELPLAAIETRHQCDSELSIGFRQDLGGQAGHVGLGNPPRGGPGIDGPPGSRAAARGDESGATRGVWPGRLGDIAGPRETATFSA